MSDEIFVYADIDAKPVLVGTLWLSKTQQFMYDRSWLSSSKRFQIDPLLPLSAWQQVAGESGFGFVADASPDRWGRNLMRRDEFSQARKENRKARRLTEEDFLLGISDSARLGALRFTRSEQGDFLAPHTDIPPLISLGRLLSATSRIELKTESESDLALMLAPGSSMGGARPKCVVSDASNLLLIAKFPKDSDEWTVSAWEHLALGLAARAGIRSAQSSLHRVDNHTVFLAKRFDRADDRRVPFLSAMSGLAKKDGEEASYLEIADFIRQYGATPKEDLIELWRRIVFNIFINNTDDHLRNHGFLYSDRRSGWVLAPAYDVNPTPVQYKGRVLTTSISADDPSAHLDVAMEVHEFFGLTETIALGIAREVAEAVSGWEREASRLSIPRHEIDMFADTFRHPDLDVARFASVSAPNAPLSPGANTRAAETAKASPENPARNDPNSSDSSP